MTLYSTILFVHGVAVLLLTATLTMETLLLWSLRRTVRGAEARIWTGAVPAISILGVSALFIIFVTGGYLSNSLGATGTAWSRFATIDVLIFAFFGGLTGIRIRAIRRFVAANGADEVVWRSLTRSSFLKMSVSIRVFIVMGTMLLTAAKPGLSLCAVVVCTALSLGTLFSFASIGRYSVAAADVRKTDAYFR